MQKKKVKFIKRLGKLVARTWIINIPALFILLVLMLMGKLSWVSALVALICFYGFSGFIIFFVFKDLDDFILYLNKVAEGVSEELPKFKKSLFSSQRLANAYQSVSSLWQKQALTDTSILENLPDPLIMTDKDHKIVFINQAGKKILGHHTLKQNVFQVFQISPLPEYQKPLFFKWQTKDKNHPLYYQGRLDTLSYPTRLGAIHAFMLHDTTHFEEFHRQQVDFFANASHELKTPLAIISGAIETLQGPAQNDLKAQQHFLSMMATQTHHMTALVQDFLTLAHLQQNKTLKQMEQIDVNQFILDLLQNLTPKAQTKKQTFHFSPLKGSLFWLGNALDLKYMIQNLVDNALKYAPEKAKISLILLKKGKNFSLAIHNTGSFIPPKYQQVIFERFYRLNTPTKQEGSGLGLNIVAYLVKKYHGQIKVQSSQKDGTTFSFSLPLSS